MAGAMNVGSIDVRLSLDAKPLQDGARKAEQTIDHLGKAVEGVSKESAGDIDKIAGAFKELARSIDSQTDKMVGGFSEVETSLQQLNQNLRKVEETANRVQTNNNNITRSYSAMGASMQAVGQKMSLAITTPLALTGFAAIKAANDFEFAMSSIAGLVGYTVEEVHSMETAVRSMATEFGRSATEAADALYFIASAGISGAAMTDVLEQSLKASAVGLGQTKVIADTVSSALNAYGEANLTASQATDALIAAVREGKMEADQLAAALPRVLPIASSMGVTFEEVSAAFAAMSLNGTDASEAATQIRAILASLLNPSKMAEEQLSALGLSSAGLRKVIREDGLLAGLEMMTQAFGNNEEAAAVVFGNIRALTGVMSLFGEATDGTRAIFQDLTNNTGDLDKAFSVMSETGTYKLNQVMAKLKDTMISFGQTIAPLVLPVLDAVAGAFQRVAEFVMKLPAPIKTALTMIAGVAMVAGPTLIALGLLTKAFGAVAAAAAIAGGAQAAQGVGAFTIGLSKMIPVISNPYVIGFAAVAVGIGVAMKVMGDNAKEARERQERLTATLREGHDPAWQYVDAVNALGEAYANAAANAPVLDTAISTAQGRFVGAELAAAGLDTAFQSAGVAIEDIARVTQTGTDAFDLLDRQITNNGNGINGWKQIMEDAALAGVPFADTLYKAYEAGTISNFAINDMIETLDKLADASDDSREELEKQAQAALTTGDTYQALAATLGTDYLVRLRDTSVAQAEAAGSATPWADALKVVKDTADRVVYVNARLAAGTNVTSTSLENAGEETKSFDQRMRDLRGTLEGGALTIEAMAQELGTLGDFLANDLQLMLIDATKSADDLFSELADGKTTFQEVEQATREASKQIAQIVVDTINLGGSSKDAVPAVVSVVDALYDGAEAAGVSREKVQQLIKEIGILDGLSPEIALALTLDTKAIEAQIQILVDRLKDSGGRSGALIQQIEDLNTMLRAVREAQTSTAGSRGGGGGGGGGGGRQGGPFDWVEGWIKDLADFTSQLMSEDFKDRLISLSADDMAKAIRDLLEEATRLGIPLLAGGTAAMDLIGTLGQQLVDAAKQMSGPGGLEERYKKATQEVERLQSALDDLTERYKEFQRVERGVGEPSTLQRLDEELNKLNDLKSTLSSLQAEYDRFRGVGVNALDEQIAKLGDLGMAVGDLESQFADFNKRIEGATGLEKELQTLDELEQSFKSLSEARKSYATQTAASMESIQFSRRGGALGTARKYLQKVGEFRDIIAGLRDRAFPAQIIRDVVAAGLEGGTSIGKRLLALSDQDLAEFKQVHQEIQSIAAQTGEIAADVLFTADVNEAQRAFEKQISLVRQTFQSAMAQAQNEFNAQQAIVQGIYEQQIAQAQMALEQQKIVVEALFKTAISEAKKQLADAEKTVKILKTAMDDLRATMVKLIDAIAKAVKDAQSGTSGGGGGGGSSGGGGGGSTGRPGQSYNDGHYTFTPDSSGGVNVVDNNTGGNYYIKPGTDFSGFKPKADGGPVLAGQKYLVGEIGPELFVPNRSGTIIPNGASMGTTLVTNEYTINVTAQPGQDVGRQIVKAIQEYERRNGTGWRA